ncbi:HAD family hydrolase [Glycomyces algeriensis]|uniref:Hydrolase n=1 Tax=Glycomyces algeriensis TaxID=256037 RepID=A0A9W6GB06_9ACTN|nr:HAD family hydrolase [Glycomyces algeriensis]MDA1367825.1 HAD family hydrolase [Glycomyces algeriensis]MDR7351971.1 Cof subfamily protein (haloacid dehalogenase superfamily) [Glycomyces algeriensis]GLI44704.1 hydrolase [Glycomyces algeriensis]
MNPPRVIATDLDGTLLAPGRILTERSRLALHAARAQGIAVVAVTARPSRVFAEWPELAACLDAAICANGAIVYDPARRVIETAHTIEPETAAATAKILRSALPGTRIAVETGALVVAEPGYRKVDTVGDNRLFVDTFDEVFTAADSIVKLLVHDPDGRADAMLAAARAVVLPGVHLSHSGGEGLLEITAPDVSKSTALAAWCAARGIGPAEVTAFGDMPNDVPMLRWAGRSFAVAGAHPEAAAAATDRCGASDEDGVAEVIEGFLAAPR